VSVADILIVDDEPEIRSLVAEVLEGRGHRVVTAADGQEALERFRATPTPVVLLDLSMPRLGGMETLPELRRLDPGVCVIIVTSTTDPSTVVQAMRLGAYDYVAKPIEPEDLALCVGRALEHRRLLSEVSQLRDEVKGAGLLRQQMGSSPAVEQLIVQVIQVAGSPFNVLIQGETGTGKELVARAIHRLSPSADGPFVAVDCGAIPDTLIESELFGYERGAFTGADRRRDGHFRAAHGGTLFLDEIGNVPLTIQAKLLRALQEKQVQPLGGTRPVPVDARIVAATNRPLEHEAREGRFRQDLYYRLSEFGIVVPPLTERRPDILHLARRFLDEAAMELKRPVRAISEEAAAALEAHGWPGNVRELRNVIRQAALRADGVVLPEHLRLGAGGGAAATAEGIAADAQPGRTLREAAAIGAESAERAAISEALRSAGGNKSAAARALGTDFKTLHLKMKRYGISGEAFRP
jgi:DNA-binding NtrC family response regulator